MSLKPQNNPFNGVILELSSVYFFPFFILVCTTLPFQQEAYDASERLQMIKTEQEKWDVNNGVHQRKIQLPDLET